jgi:hypothetical protein
MYLVTVMYLAVCVASNSLQLIFSFSAVNLTLFSSVACACVVDISSDSGAEFEVLVSHIPFVSLVVNAHAVARLIVGTMFVDCS